jgi:hypothetical protein
MWYLGSYSSSPHPLSSKDTKSNVGWGLALLGQDVGTLAEVRYKFWLRPYITIIAFAHIFNLKPILSFSCGLTFYKYPKNAKPFTLLSILR